MAAVSLPPPPATSDQVRRAMTMRQWDELRNDDVPVFADIVTRVDLVALKEAALANTEASRDYAVDAEDLSVVLHAAKAGDVIDWETHDDEAQMVFVVVGELRVTQGRVWNVKRLTLAIISPNVEHRLEAPVAARYASLYLKVDRAIEQE